MVEHALTALRIKNSSFATHFIKSSYIKILVNQRKYKSYDEAKPSFTKSTRQFRQASNELWRINAADCLALCA